MWPARIGEFFQSYRFDVFQFGIDFFYSSTFAFEICGMGWRRGLWSPALLIFNQRMALREHTDSLGCIYISFVNSQKRED